MFSEETKKQLELFSGILAALVVIIGKATELVTKREGVPLIVYGAILLFGVWMLVKWRTRHSRLLKPDALRLDRDNAEHLAGRAEDIGYLLQQCRAKQVVQLEGESGSGKSALVRAGFLLKLQDDKSVLPLLLDDWWVNEWDRSPFVALKNALITSGAVSSGAAAKSADDQLQPAARHLSTLADVEQALIRLNDDEEECTPLIIFDQFDDYQTRNRERFLPNKTWLDPVSLRQSNPFWDMVARLLEQDKLRCLFVTRSDTAGGLSSIEFLGPVQPYRLDRVRSPYIAELLTRLTEGTPVAPVIADPDAGWTKLRERIIGDISEQDVILPQQLKIMLGGIQSLKRLNVKQYERVGGAAGIEAFYVEQQINRTARTLELASSQVRAMLVELIDPHNKTKTRSRSKEELLEAALKGNGKQIASDKLDKALEELERGEILRSLSDPEIGRTAYRLDHDYLTRSVSAANERANRWHYFLEDRAKAFQNAATLWKKWKALLPVGTQCRLAWARVRGRFRYGNRRSYALWSLARFPTRVVSLVLLFYLAFGLVGLGIWSTGGFGSKKALANIDSYLGEVQSMRDPAQILYLTSSFEQNVGILEFYQPYEAFQEQALTVAGKIIEMMQTTTNTDRAAAQLGALVYIASRLKPAEVKTLAGSIPPKIQSTTDAAHIYALARAFEAISAHLRPETAQALAKPLYEAIKGAGNSDQRHALGLALAAIATQLKQEEAATLDGPIIEAIKDTDENAPGTALGDAVNQGSKALSQDAPAQESTPRRRHSRH